MNKAEKRRTQLKELIAERIALRIERDRYRKALKKIADMRAENFGSNCNVAQGIARSALVPRQERLADG